MNIKEQNKYTELDDCYLLKIAYKDIWYKSYISKEDYEKVRTRHWRASHKKQKVYLVSGSKWKDNVVYLHNFVLNYTYVPGYEVDHWDGNSLNNRRENLHVVTRQANIDNMRVRIDNEIGIRGISYDSNKKLYTCDFYYHGNRYYFKQWKTIQEAVYCRKFAEEYFGQSTLIRNPLAKQYLTLNDTQAEEIKEYVHQKISRK